jgi:hypothetical protein
MGQMGRMKSDGTPPVGPLGEAALDIACGADACFIDPVGPIGPIGHGVVDRAASAAGSPMFFRREP